VIFQNKNQPIKSASAKYKEFRLALDFSSESKSLQQQNFSVEEQVYVNILDQIGKILGLRFP
jgi:hypothetical protein